MPNTYCNSLKSTLIIWIFLLTLIMLNNLKVFALEWSGPQMDITYPENWMPIPKQDYDASFSPINDNSVSVNYFILQGDFVQIAKNNKDYILKNVGNPSLKLITNSPGTYAFVYSYFVNDRNYNIYWQYQELTHSRVLATSYSAESSKFDYYWNDFSKFYNSAVLDKANELTYSIEQNEKDIKMMQDWMKQSDSQFDSTLEILKNTPHRICEDHLVGDHYVTECRTEYG